MGRSVVMLIGNGRMNDLGSALHRSATWLRRTVTRRRIVQNG